MTDITKLIEELDASADGMGDTEYHRSVMRRAAAALRDCSAGDTKIPFEAIIASYNTHLGPYLPRASRCPPGRKAVIRARWLEHPDQRTLEWWDKFFARCAASDFLTGRRAPGNGHDNWQANFDWITKSANATKIIEGVYDNRGPRTNTEQITRFR